MQPDFTISVDNKERRSKNIFKVGRTVQCQPGDWLYRLDNYGANPLILSKWLVPEDQVVEVETNIIRRFKQQFCCVLGREYFAGDQFAMLKIVNDECNRCFRKRRRISSSSSCHSSSSDSEEHKEIDMNDLDGGVVDADSDYEPQSQIGKVCRRRRSSRLRRTHV